MKQKILHQLCLFVQISKKNMNALSITEIQPVIMYEGAGVLPATIEDTDVCILGKFYSGKDEIIFNVSLVDDDTFVQLLMFYETYKETSIRDPESYLSYPTFIFNYEDNIYSFRKYIDVKNITLLSVIEENAWKDVMELNFSVDDSFIQYHNFFFITSELQGEDVNGLFMFDIHTNTTHFIGGRIRRKGCSVLYKGKIYFLGGYPSEEGDTIKKLILFDIETFTFEYKNSHGGDYDLIECRCIGKIT